MTATYWEVGRRIVELEQQGENRAECGKQLVERLAQDLSTRFGRGFKRSNLFQMWSFYLTYPTISDPLPAQFDSPEIFQTLLYTVPN